MTPTTEPEDDLKTESPPSAAATLRTVRSARRADADTPWSCHTTTMAPAERSGVTTAPSRSDHASNRKWFRVQKNTAVSEELPQSGPKPWRPSRGHTPARSLHWTRDSAAEAKPSQVCGGYPHTGPVQGLHAPLQLRPPPRDTAEGLVADRPTALRSSRLSPCPAPA